MRRRCQTARPLGKFLLTSARLVFRGVADLEHVPGESVPCGLWIIQRQDERELDAYEGIGLGRYMKSEDIVLKYNGEPRRALIYLMNSEAIYPPSQAYVDTIRRGYRDFGLDENYLDQAIARSYTDKRPDAATRARRARQLNSETHRKLAEIPGSVAPVRATGTEGEPA